MDWQAEIVGQLGDLPDDNFEKHYRRLEALIGRYQDIPMAEKKPFMVALERVIRNPWGAISWGVISHTIYLAYRVTCTPSGGWSPEITKAVYDMKLSIIPTRFLDDIQGNRDTYLIQSAMAEAERSFGGALVG